MMKSLRQITVLLCAFMLLCGVAYPALVTGIAKVAFPHQAEGSLVVQDGKVIGSSLIGQSFRKRKYFWGRPSAAAYNAASSSGSNLSNAAVVDVVNARIIALHKADPKNRLPIPVDLVTASASGLDPHISVAAAHYQIPRIAKARGISEERLQELVDNSTENRIMGIWGETVVNVLEMNLALDRPKQ